MYYLWGHPELPTANLSISSILRTTFGDHMLLFITKPKSRIAIILRSNFEQKNDIITVNGTVEESADGIADADVDDLIAKVIRLSFDCKGVK